MGSFHRVDTSKLIRGAGRILYAPSGQAKPTQIDDVFRTGTSTQDEVQTVTITGTPTGGNFKLRFDPPDGPSEETANIAYNANAAAVESALEALSTIDAADVAVTGGPGPGTPYVVTFGGKYADKSLPMMSATHTFTGGTTPNIAVTETTAGFGQFDARTGWADLGATREGIQVTINNTEDSYEVDQVQGEIGSAPNSWECSVSTRFAEVDLEHMVTAWEGAPITTDLVTGERETGFAGATEYTEYRLAVAFRRPNTKLMCLMFHRAVRSPQEATLDFRKGGDPITIPHRFKILADATETDVRMQFFRIREQI